MLPRHQRAENGIAPLNPKIQRGFLSLNFVLKTKGFLLEIAHAAVVMRSGHGRRQAVRHRRHLAAAVVVMRRGRRANRAGTGMPGNVSGRAVTHRGGALRTDIKPEGEPRGFSLGGKATYRNSGNGEEGIFFVHGCNLFGCLCGGFVLAPSLTMNAKNSKILLIL